MHRPSPTPCSRTQPSCLRLRPLHIDVMASSVNSKINELGSGTSATVPLFENLGTPESIHTDEKVPGPGWIGVKLIESPVKLSFINRLWTKSVCLVKMKLPIRASASLKEASRTENVKLE